MVVLTVDSVVARYCNNTVCGVARNLAMGGKGGGGSNSIKEGFHFQADKQKKRQKRIIIKFLAYPPPPKKKKKKMDVGGGCWA